MPTQPFDPDADRRRPSPIQAGRRAVFVLWALAVAQPLFEQLAGSPEFLVFHDLRGLRLVLLVLGLFVGPPALAGLVAEAAGRTVWRRRLYAGWTHVCAALLALVVLRRAAPEAGLVAAGGVVAAAAGATAYLLLRTERGRGLLAVLVGLVWAIPGLFLLRPEIRPALFHHADATSPAPQAEVAAVPVILVVWDELPTATLLTAEGEIDGRWFPAFRRLADTSTWFRDTVAASTMTSQAVPSLLSGVAPTSHETWTDVGLFQELDGHSLLAYSHVEGIVPDTATRLTADTAAGSWSAVASDLGLLYLHLSMPAAFRRNLPPVSASWGGFATPSREAEALDAALAHLERRLGTAGTPADSAPFVYLHSALPHHPWIYLPSGAVYPPGDQLVAPGFFGVADTGRWSDRPWPVVQAYQRHVLQTMFADRTLGRLMDLLVEAGLWQESLVVVTADHGAAFAARAPLRVATPATVAEAASVPLFVKLPGQTDGRVDERPASTLDVAPTVLSVLGREVPAAVDGLDLSAPVARDSGALRARFVHHDVAPTLTVNRDLWPDVLAVARRRAQWFDADRADRRDPFRIGPYSQLVGRTVSELEVDVGGSGSAELDAREPLPHEVGARLHFELSMLPRTDRPLAFAAALDERIVATGALFPGAGTSDLWMMLPEETARALPSKDLRLFRIEVVGADARLVELPLSSVRYRLVDDGRTIVAGERKWEVVAGAFRGELYRLPLPSSQTRVLAWAIDSEGRPPERLLVLAGDRTLAAPESGIPRGDFLDLLTFERPEEQVFFAAFPAAENVRYFALGSDGRAAELAEVAPTGSSTTKVAPDLPEAPVPD